MGGVVLASRHSIAIEQYDIPIVRYVIRYYV